MVELLVFVSLSLGLGFVTETLAYSQGFWTYRNRRWLFMNLLIVFGLVFGALSFILRDELFIVKFASGALFGVLYEWTNFAFLHAWTFKDNRLLFLRGRIALTFGVGLLWGLIVPLNSAINNLR